jgi:hypothetical protein
MMWHVTIDEHGARGVHSDEAAAVLREVGTLSIRRASHVEPDSSGQWWADLSPVGGPLLGPFDTRGEALASELQYLYGEGF